MKKIIALALTFVMVLALVPVFTYAAPEGTGIDSLDKITDLTGKYYLTKDITVETTLAGEFTGTFDGNGKTVTVKAAMFASVKNATVGNFKVTGELTDPANTYKVNDSDAFSYYSAVAIVAAGKTTFKDITSDVKFTDTKGVRYGTIAAYAPAEYDLTFTNCVNNGAITAHQHCGGLFGWTDKEGKASFENCANNGAVSSDAGLAGGLASSLGATDSTLTFKNCANTGAIKATGKNTEAAGFVPNVSCAPVFENCTNSGAVNAVRYCGGFIALLTNSVKMINCVNTAAITGASHTGGFIGINNMSGASTGEWLMEGCVNTGNITCTGTGSLDAGGFVGQNNKAAPVPTVYKFNYCVNTGNVTSNKRSGGLVGYSFAAVPFEANACISVGTITGSAYASHLVGYTVANDTKIKNCVIGGKVVGNVDACVLAIFSMSGVDFSKAVIENLYVVGDCGYKQYSYDYKEKYNIQMKDAPAGTIVSATSARLESGEIAYALNTFLGKNVFRQTIGTDKVPTLDADAKEVIKNADGTYSNPKAPETTEPSETTNPGTPTVKPTPTGDITVSIVVVAAVALLGLAYTSKKIR